MAPATLFELGNLATTLLILRATNLLQADVRSLTAANSVDILLYAAHNGASTLASLVGGQLADRLSAGGVFAAGAGVYVLGYALFAWEQHQWPILLVGFLLCGISIGFAETAESTVVAHLLPEHQRSNGFGVLGLVQSLGDFGATLVAGILWSGISATVAFLYAATWMALSVAASARLRPRR
jgi:MFS family permease